MITSVKIKDNTKTPFEYVSDIEAFENGREFIFKPGVNVIVGKNGSGKSTLLNIISMYALCEKSMCSEIPIEALDFPPIFDDDDDKVLDGIDISSDYAGKVFRLLPSAEMNRDSVLKNISNLDLYVNNIRKSYGEKVVLSFDKVNKENKDPELESINSFNDTVKKANEIKDRVLKYVDKIKQERAYNIDLCMTFERYIEIADKDAERAMAFLKEAYPFNEETEVFIRKRYNMSIDVDPEEN